MSVFLCANLTYCINLSYYGVHFCGRFGAGTSRPWHNHDAPVSALRRLRTQHARPWQPLLPQPDHSRGAWQRPERPGAAHVDQPVRAGEVPLGHLARLVRPGLLACFTSRPPSGLPGGLLLRLRGSADCSSLLLGAGHVPDVRSAVRLDPLTYPGRAAEDAVVTDRGRPHHLVRRRCTLRGGSANPAI